MMKSLHLFIPALSAICLLSCKESEEQKKPSSGEGSDWKLEAFYPSKVEVYTNGKQVETYVFSFDKNECLSSLTRTDNLTGNKLLDVSYQYSGDNDMSASCLFYSSTTKRSCSATLDRDSNTLTCTSDISSPWTIDMALDSDGNPRQMGIKWNYSSTKYTSEGSFSEVYHISEGDVDSYEAGCDISCRNTKSTEGTSSETVTWTYTYSDDLDNQNFGMFLMNCQFHVWAAAGLPGNRHLITGMKASCGGVDLPQSFTVSYKFNSDGDIISAVRKDYNGKTLILTREYKFSYE